MARKTFREIIQEELQKQMTKRENQLLKLEKRYLRQALPGEWVVARATTNIMKDLVARGWEVVTIPNQARVSYTLRIPRSILEERING